MAHTLHALLCTCIYTLYNATISLYIMNMHSYCQNTSMRLFVIGHFQKGKSTLIAALRRRQQSSSFDERTKRSLDPDYHLTEDGMYVVHVCGCMYMYIYTYNYVHCTVGMITHNKANSCWVWRYFSLPQSVILQLAYSVISGYTRGSVVGKMSPISHFTPGTLLDRYVHYMYVQSHT